MEHNLELQSDPSNI